MKGIGNPARLDYHTMEIFCERFKVPGNQSIESFFELGNRSML